MQTKRSTGFNYEIARQWNNHLTDQGQKPTTGFNPETARQMKQTQRRQRSWGLQHKG